MSRIALLAARWARARSRMPEPPPEPTEAPASEVVSGDATADSTVEVQWPRKMPRPLAFKRWPAGAAAMNKMSAEAKTELWAAVKNGNAEAEAALVRDNSGLIVPVVKRYHNATKHSDIPFEDLVNIGNEALLKAIRMYDASLGWTLSTWATKRIKHALQRHIANLGLAVRVPVDRIWRRKSNAAQSNPATEYAVVAAKFPLRLDAPMAEDDDSSLHDVIASPIPTPEALCAANEKSNVLRALALLSERGRYILTQTVLEGRTLHDVGDELGVSRERVRQVQAKALNQLRKKLIQIERPQIQPARKKKQ